MTKPGYREHYNVQQDLVAENVLDENENPTGGNVVGVGLKIEWQSEPRATGEFNADGSPVLKAPNGAFVEDALWAALQRLEFFNETKYRDRGNSLAITHIEQALQALKDRQLQRSYRGVEGAHKV
jgi:hypothetical protein